MINKTIGEIVSLNILYADVFQKRGIDYCCKGHIPLADIKGISIQELINELHEAVNTQETIIDFDKMSISELIYFIEKTYHSYRKNVTPDILFLLKKIKTKHGKIHPELVQMYELFSKSAEDLSHHMYKEEHALFPYINDLQNNVRNNKSSFESIQNPIFILQKEHENEGLIFEKLRSISNSYIPPEDACNSYKLTFFKLNEFEEKLHKHIHLENNILFPKAITLDLLARN
jgi:regulator of cell morphogenesis and NO signaling